MRKTPETIRLYGMTMCVRCGAKIYERVFNHDLNRFDVYKGQDEYVGSTYLYSIDEMEEIDKALKNGECPLCDNWKMDCEVE
ncbi:MAG TPA: hypothetical protein GX530_09690 [Corynebacteriales bacterium]|nr:hypothetical protein [Mycobacteriales bacterium]